MLDFYEHDLLNFTIFQFQSYVYSQSWNKIKQNWFIEKLRHVISKRKWKNIIPKLGGRCGNKWETLILSKTKKNAFLFCVLRVKKSFKTLDQDLRGQNMSKLNDLPIIGKITIHATRCIPPPPPRPKGYI
jgi:hypothetical protein